MKITVETEHDPNAKVGHVEVIFRWWEGDVIALFPTIPATYRLDYSKNSNVSSYQHIGQHGESNGDGIMENSRPATLKEYADLLEELTKIGYNLRVVSDFKQAHRDRRNAIIKSRRADPENRPSIWVE